MRLHALCYYRSRSEQWTDSWRDEDYRALKFVKAVKRLPFNGTTQIRRLGQVHTIENTPVGQATALTLAGQSIAGEIARAGYMAAAVIPIPSSNHTDPDAMFTGRRLAEVIQRTNEAFKSTPMLYFDQVLAKSRGGGGSRNPWAIKQHLRHRGAMPTCAVLLDDVCTSGGHLIAAAQYFAERGLEIADAFVVGRTAWERPRSMFSVAVEDLDTTDPFASFDF